MSSEGLESGFDQGEAVQGAKLLLSLKQKLDTATAVAAQIVEGNRLIDLESMTAEEIESSRRQLRPEFKDIEYDFLGSDTVINIHMYPPGDQPVNHKLFNIAFKLQRDGSPFVPDVFIDEVDQHDTGLLIFVGPEVPPFVVTSARLMVTSANQDGFTGFETRYLQELQEQGKQPHTLSSQEIDQVITMLPLLEIDPERQLLESANLYLPPDPRLV